PEASVIGTPTTGSLAAEAATGNLPIENLATGSLAAEAATGNLPIENLATGSLAAEAATGNLPIENLATGSLAAEAGTGILDGSQPGDAPLPRGCAASGCRASGLPASRYRQVLIPHHRDPRRAG